MRRAFLAFVLAVVLPAAACSSTTEGSAVKDTSAPPQPTIDVNSLDTGPYSTKPAQPLGVAGDPARGVVIEAQRMANHVIGPWEVDPAVTGWFGFGALVLDSAQAMTLIGPSELAAVAGKHNFVNGFTSARTEANKKLLMTAVLRFPDETAAKDAATELGESALKQQGADGPAQKVQIPGHDDAQANSFVMIDRDAGRWNAVRAFTAHGSYVFMQLAQSTESVDGATALVAKTLDLQGPEIDNFRATDPAEFADISVDPTGLLARTVPVEPRDLAGTQYTTYEQRGALHFQSDPARSSKLFADTGTDLVAMAKTNIYEAENAEGATGVVDGFFAELQPTSQPANAVRNMPDSRCLRLKDGAFYCLATVDRYAIEVSGKELLDTQQLVAAQYAVLTSG
ncbi:DUF7373 family lipoprotein [Mycobacterium deserti]|uniref:Lipoprotein n=1 Tax=Mycobacterium deserti TaxID=2978347 RepID=A0ABT2MJI8_9MYCO|nr:hypothetical protein [Mycobacterium deserti]MCT7661260.1 hypothetical protein [Mycobacterium deserti]